MWEILIEILTSFSNPPTVESARVRDKILRSSFLGAVIQLTQVFGNDVIEAWHLTSLLQAWRQSSDVDVFIVW